ncbi:nitrate/nitrite transporter NrtS [Alteromonas australica]|uniref:nitrate/nitrite transporter NrtS n=1 Tax=Alteromonas australica TaxID=589873 RepID=UPI0035C7920D
MSCLASQKPHWLAIAFRASVVTRGIKIALIVGSVLALLNHGDKIFSATLSQSDLYRILVTYLVPYCVSTYSAVRNELTHWVPHKQ